MPNVRINTTIRGEIADVAIRLKQRGVVVSNADLVRQAILALHREIMEKDLNAVKLKAIDISDS